MLNNRIIEFKNLRLSNKMCEGLKAHKCINIIQLKKNI